VDIARALGVPEGTVRRWKSIQNWDGKNGETESERSEVKANARKQNKRTPQSSTKPNNLDHQLAAAVEANDELSKQEKDFCLYFSRIRNATQAYLKAYGCAYNTARTEGSRTLANPNIQAELARLREIKIASLGLLCGEDIVDLRARLAFTDITDFVEVRDGAVSVKDSDQVDGQLISEISEGKNGVRIKLEGREKSLVFLEGYLKMKATEQEAEAKRGEDRQLFADILRNPAPNRELPADE